MQGTIFERGRAYRRAELHDAWGGETQVQRMGGILTPKEAPVVILITGEEGHEFGYTDWRDSEGVWHYYGAGQEGPMQWVRGNTALRDHARNGEDVHIFERMPDGMLRYEGQYVCADIEIRDDVPDKHKHPRTGFIFSLVPFDDAGGGDLSAPPASGPSKGLWGMSLIELKQRASKGPDVNFVDSQESRHKVYTRSEALRVYVLKRADGKCEGCKAPAPFKTKAGRPYLEPHHTTRLSDGGPDHPSHVIALCPTCHRRVHYGDDGEAYNATLKSKLALIE